MYCIYLFSAKIPIVEPKRVFFTPRVLFKEEGQKLQRPQCLARLQLPSLWRDLVYGFSHQIRDFKQKMVVFLYIGHIEMLKNMYTGKRDANSETLHMFSCHELTLFGSIWISRFRVLNIVKYL